VAYAVECRRHIKEQMNKRKTDDEFAMINLSYVNSKGEEIVVYCPESKHAPATQHPSRRTIDPSFLSRKPLPRMLPSRHLPLPQSEPESWIRDIRIAQYSDHC
jgi:ATP-dependent Lon protease